MKRRTLTAEAIKAAGSRATKASAKLEDREVPPGHLRSATLPNQVRTVASVSTCWPLGSPPWTLLLPRTRAPCEPFGALSSPSRPLLVRRRPTSLPRCRRAGDPG